MYRVPHQISDRARTYASRLETKPTNGSQHGNEARVALRDLHEPRLVVDQCHAELYSLARAVMWRQGVGSRPLTINQDDDGTGRWLPSLYSLAGLGVEVRARRTSQIQRRARTNDPAEVFRDGWLVVD